MKLIVAENNPEDAQFITAAFGSREDARILQGASVLTAARDPADAGWEIALAQSASECLDLLATEAADLLLLDAELPGGDALELLQQIKQAHPKLPVIMIMPPGGEAELQGTRAMRQNAISYVTKSPGWKSRLPLMVEQWWRSEQTQKDAERATSELDALRQHYQTILAYTREAALALNPAGVIVHFSPSAERVLGYRADQAIGEHIAMLYDSPETVHAILEAAAEPGLAQTAAGGRKHPHDISRLPGVLRLLPPEQEAPDEQAPRAMTREALSHDGEEVSERDAGAPAVIRYETFLRHSQGHFLICEVTTAAVHDTQGILTGYICLCRELTEEREARRELLRNKSLLRSITDSAPINIIIVSATGGITSANKNVERSLGYPGRNQRSLTGLIGQQVALLTSEPDKLREVIELTLQTGEPQQLILEMVDVDGVPQSHQVFTALVRDPASAEGDRGSAEGVMLLTIDLSQQRRHLEVLRTELKQAHSDERRARALFDTAGKIADADDLYGVFAHIAHGAASQLGFDQVTLYRADHEQGLLVGVVRALGASSQVDSSQPQPLRDVQLKLAPGGPDVTGLIDFALGDEPYRLLSPESGPRPGDGPSEKADNRHPTSNQQQTANGPTSDIRPTANGKGVGSRKSEVGSRGNGREPPVADSGPRSELLVQLRTPGDSAEAGLVGVIRAVNYGESGEAAPITAQQISLLCALAHLGSVTNERARMEQLRSQLISSVSHELRTPLAAIRAYNELILDGDAGPINEEQRLFLSRIETTSMQLNRILDDLLDLSRMRAGEMSVRKGPTDVMSCIQHIINTVQPEAAKKGIKVESRIQPQLPIISTDADRLTQALMNLVDNAIKYGHQGGAVVVEARLDDADLLISVADDGPGIAADDLEKIFDEFHRGSHVTERKTKGAGLGLAIVSRLTRLLGGTVYVDSAVGEGSTFYLRFPLAHLEKGTEPFSSEAADSRY